MHAKSKWPLLYQGLNQIPTTTTSEGGGLTHLHQVLTTHPDTILFTGEVVSCNKKL